MTYACNMRSPCEAFDPPLGHEDLNGAVEAAVPATRETTCKLLKCSDGVMDDAGVLTFVYVLHEIRVSIKEEMRRVMEFLVQTHPAREHGRRAPEGLQCEVPYGPHRGHEVAHPYG